MSTEWFFMAVIALGIGAVVFTALCISLRERREDRRIQRFLEEENYRQWRLSLQDEPLPDTFPEEWTRV